MCRPSCHRGVINSVTMKRCLSTGSVSGNSSTNDSFVTVVNNKKAKKGRQKSQISATQPLTANNNVPGSISLTEMDSVISSVVNCVDSDHGSCCSQCEKLKFEMSSMMSNITQLSHKVEFLLSFLGLDNDPSNLAQVQPSSRDRSGSTSNSAVPDASQSNKVSYANAARTKPTQLSSQMRQAVMSADLECKST